MKVILVVLCLLVMLAGCAHQAVPYDRQFSTLETVDKDGVTRSHAWSINPSREKMANFKVSP